MNEFENDLLNTTYKAGTQNTDIQNKLYSWFEKTGLVNKLSAHIREQMIFALKDCAAWSVNKSNVTSPKTQAINLLVADFLMNQENLFTLSVFMTEVPLLGNLHEFSSYVNCLNSSIQTKPVIKPSFILNDAQDILEALGVQPKSEITELTCQYYFNDNLVHSLLTCLFKAVTTVTNNLNKYDEVLNNNTCFNKSTKNNSNNYEYRLNNWLVSVEDTLSSFNLNEVQKKTLIKLFKNFHQNNNSQEASVYKEQLKKLEKQNKEMIKKVADAEQMLASHFHSRDSSLLFQKEHATYATEQLQLEQQQLYQLINIFEEKEKSMQEKRDRLEQEYNKKLQDIENQKYKLKIQEIEVSKLKEEPLKHVNEIRTVGSDQVKLVQEQNVELTKQLQEIKLELKEYKKKEEECSKKIVDDLQGIETSLNREMLRKLQRENDELREFIKVQRDRIEELSVKAANLAKQFEKTHQGSPVTTNYFTQNLKKKLHFVNNSSKTIRYSNQNISSTTTDHSTTLLDSDNHTEDDIILEARSRLKILEINSAKVENKLKVFQKNSMSYTDYKGNRVNNRKPYEICSNLSDDSEIPTLKSTSNKINLKELTNKIGYHRSIRQYIKNSSSENDTNPEILHNTKFQNNTNVTNISPIKKYTANTLSSKYVHKSLYQKFPIHKSSYKQKFPDNRLSNYRTEFSINRPNIISTESSNENQEKIKLTIGDKRLLTSINSQALSNLENQAQIKTIENTEMRHHVNLPKTSDNNENLVKNYLVENHIINSHLFNDVQLIDSPQNGANIVDTLLRSSKKETESDHSISFASEKTDKSSNF